MRSLSDQGRGYAEPAAQVVVVDTGVGIFESLRHMHPSLSEPRAALVKAIEPHISGAFPEGEEGTEVNAGLGLFFIAEMAKLTGGRLLIATRGATLLLTGDPKGEGANELRILEPRNLGFPGTLVLFEAPRDSVADHDALIRTINMRAKERKPRRGSKTLLRYSEPAPEASQYLVRLAAEDTNAAQQLSTATLLPLVTQRKPIVLNFEGMDIATQSFLHALLFEVLRVAWALRVPVHVRSAAPAIREGLDFLESYALGD